MNDNYYCVIMAGGSGTRFWPMSRNDKPKQFLDILSLGRTFLQSTFDRFAQIVPKENILVVTSAQYYDIVREQIPEMPDDNILLEPYKRNTAPCIAYATYKLLAKNPYATVVVTPSDHFITNEANFCSNIRAALDLASNSDSLYTVGINPTRPDVNYGYIQFNKSSRNEFEGESVFQIKTFTEKPNLEVAKVFIETGEFLWNSGMFIWNLQSIKREMESSLPEVASLFKGGCYYTESEKEFINKVYGDCPSISIDYGVMEKTKKALVFLSTFGWSDVGTWTSVYEQSQHKDDNGNIIKCDASLLPDVRGSIIKEDKPNKLVAIRGLDNYLVIDTDDVLMICPKEDKVVKQFVADLTSSEKTKYL